MMDKMISIWSDEVRLPEFCRLEGDIKVDVLIIGGGMAGLLCAHALQKAGVDYILVEADRICKGVTKNTTAKITSQHGLIFDKMLGRFGVERTKMYLEANEAALAEYRRICESIDCNFETRDSYVYSVNDSKKIEKELTALDKVGYKAHWSDASQLPFPVASAVRFGSQAQFNPLKFAAGIAKNLRIYEQTKVLELVGNTAICKGAVIRAKKIIVTTHFPFINKHGSYFLKLYQHRSYVVALDGARDVGGMYVDENEKGLSFRNYGGILLLGGGDHRTGKSGGGWRELEEKSEKYYPGSRILYRWATQDCMSLDSIPYIGQYSKNTPTLFVASGFNKWGMTTSMVAANLLCDLVREKNNDYAPVFSPSRSLLRPQLAVNGFEAVTNLLRPTSPRCPHLGCALKWNAEEKSWDCSCHGSRFAADGKLLDNPSTDDLPEKSRK